MVTFDEMMNDVEITDEQIRQDSSIEYFCEQSEDETLKYSDVFNMTRANLYITITSNGLCSAQQVNFSYQTR